MEIPDTNVTTAPTVHGIGSSKVRHGTILEVICDEHYEFPLTTLSPPTCNNGTWSTIPRCVPARCKVRKHCFDSFDNQKQPYLFNFCSSYWKL